MTSIDEMLAPNQIRGGGLYPSPSLSQAPNASPGIIPGLYANTGADKLLRSRGQNNGTGGGGLYPPTVAGVPSPSLRPVSTPGAATVGGDPNYRLNSEQVNFATSYDGGQAGLYPATVQPSTGSPSTVGPSTVAAPAALPPPPTATGFEGPGPMERAQGEHPFLPSSWANADVKLQDKEHEFQVGKAQAAAGLYQLQTHAAQLPGEMSERQARTEEILAANDRISRNAKAMAAASKAHLAGEDPSGAYLEAGGTDPSAIATLRKEQPFTPGFTNSEDVGGPAGGSVFQQSSQSAQFIPERTPKPQFPRTIDAGGRKLIEVATGRFTDEKGNPVAWTDRTEHPLTVNEFMMSPAIADRFKGDYGSYRESHAAMTKQAARFDSPAAAPAAPSAPATAAGPATTNAPQEPPTLSPQDAAKLAKGTRFKTSDGRILVKQ